MCALVGRLQDITLRVVTEGAAGSVIPATLIVAGWYSWSGQGTESPLRALAFGTAPSLRARRRDDHLAPLHVPPPVRRLLERVFELKRERADRLPSAVRELGGQKDAALNRATT